MCQQLPNYLQMAIHPKYCFGLAVQAVLMIEQKKLPRRLRSPVEVNVCMPVMPSHVSPEILQAEVGKLRGDWK